MAHLQLQGRDAVTGQDELRLRREGMAETVRPA